MSHSTLPTNLYSPVKPRIVPLTPQTGTSAVFAAVGAPVPALAAFVVAGVCLAGGPAGISPVLAEWTVVRPVAPPAVDLALLVFVRPTARAWAVAAVCREDAAAAGAVVAAYLHRWAVRPSLRDVRGASIEGRRRGGRRAALPWTDEGALAVDGGEDR